MAAILIIYSTTDGQTLKICRRLQQVITQHNHQVSLLSVADAAHAKIAQFDKIVIGASIRYGKHSRHVYDFINNNRSILDTKPNAFFSVNVVARKAGKNSPETNPYLKRFLSEIAWQPEKTAVFAGRINYRMYGPWDRFIIRLIMRITNGPTDPESDIEFTDWQQVEDFGHLIAKI